MQNERELMQRVARGDRAAITELYDRFGSLVYRMAYQLLPTKADAEDAVQEIFVRLWQSAAQFDPERASLVTWVILLTRRYLVDQLRRSKTRIKPGSMSEEFQASDPQAVQPHGEMLQTERGKKLQEKIAALPELQRQVIERAYLGGKTLREIGQELDKPIGTIKSALSRALAELRDRVPSEEGL